MNAIIDQPRILYANEIPENRLLIDNVSQHNYRISHCLLEECLNTSLEEKPDVVIFELNEATKERSLLIGSKIRQNLINTGIIYLSNEASNELRFDCYDSGADDFVHKPFDTDILIDRIELLLKSKQAEYQQKSNSEQIQKLASTSISIVGEQGVIIHFFQDSISLNTYSSLADKLFEELANLGLSSALAVWCNSEAPFYSSDGIVHAIERSILKVGQDTNKRKISTYGKRCMLLGKHTTLLIRNLPEDIEKAGRYKDLFAMLIDGIDLLCSQILLKDQLSKSEMQLTQTMLLTNQSIGNLKNRTAESRGKIKTAVSDLMTQMEKKFMKLDMTEEQENELYKLVLKLDKTIDQQISEIIDQEEEMGNILEHSNNQRWNNSF